MGGVEIVMLCTLGFRFWTKLMVLEAEVGAWELTLERSDLLAKLYILVLGGKIGSMV